jgi:hypothetical protein
VVPHPPTTLAGDRQDRRDFNDPLDPLRIVDYGGGARTRFRYVGLTTDVEPLAIGEARRSSTLGQVSGDIGNQVSSPFHEGFPSLGRLRATPDADRSHLD